MTTCRSSRTQSPATTRSRRGCACPPGLPLRVTGVPARALFAAWRSSSAAAHRALDRTGRRRARHQLRRPARARSWSRDGPRRRVPPRPAPRVARVTPIRRAPAGGVAARRDRPRVQRHRRRRPPAPPPVPGRPRACASTPGSPRPATATPRPDAPLAGADRYVLALGTVEPRKNLPRLVRHSTIVADGDAELRLVVAGPDGWGTDRVHRTRSEPRATVDRVVRLGYVDDAARARPARRRACARVPVARRGLRPPAAGGDARRSARSSRPGPARCPRCSATPRSSSTPSSVDRARRRAPCGRRRRRDARTDSSPPATSASTRYTWDARRPTSSSRSTGGSRPRA